MDKFNFMKKISESKKYEQGKSTLIIWGKTGEGLNMFI